MKSSDTNALRKYAQRMRQRLLPLAMAHVPLGCPNEVALGWFNRLNALRVLGLRGLAPASPMAGDLPLLAQSLGGRFSLLVSGGVSGGLPPPEALPALWSEVEQGLTEAGPQTLGWLHQYFQIEHKAQVQRSLGGARKIAHAELAPLTQIFTPDWIVRMLLETTLGRLWKHWHPESALPLRWDGAGGGLAPVLAPVLALVRPRDLRLADPACGAGHILVQAFDLLFAIHTEVGASPLQACEEILGRNLIGMDIDPMVADLARFALLLKAHEHLRPDDFAALQARPKIVVFQDVTFTQAEREVLPKALVPFLEDIAHAGQLGILIRSEVTPAMLRLKVPKAMQARLAQAREMAEALSLRPHILLANPPYMGARDMDGALMARVKAIGGKPRFDLFAAMMLRFNEMLPEGGMAGLLTPNVWLYLPTYEAIRERMIRDLSLKELIELPLSAFEDATVQLCAFTYAKAQSEGLTRFTRLVTCSGEMEEMEGLALDPQAPASRHHIPVRSFEKTPSRIFAYWLGPRSLELFDKAAPLAARAVPRQGLATTDNARFLRLWHELPREALTLGVTSREGALASGRRWFPYNKGGEYRRWYGNADYMVDWQNDGQAIKAEVLRKYPYLKGNPDFVTKNQSCYFKPAVTWTYINSTNLGVRHSDAGFIFDVAGSSVFPQVQDHDLILGLLCSKVAKHFIDAINPTLNIQAGSIGAIPLPPLPKDIDLSHVPRAVELARQDWNEREMSWSFKRHPLLGRGGLAEAWEALRQDWAARVAEMQRLEHLNNATFIAAYGLEGELAPDMPLDQVTLFANPVWRYGAKTTEEAREARLKSDTYAGLLHYAIGCLLGRYEEPAAVSLLQLDQGAGLLGEWLIRHFGAASVSEMEAGLGQDIASWLRGDFMALHLSMTRRRPWFWQFGPPKDAFRVIFAAHAYRPDMLADLVAHHLPQEIRKREADLAAAIEAGAKPKVLEAMGARLQALRLWAEEVMGPLAKTPPSIDLEEGVIAEHAKFGRALTPLR